MSDSTARRAEVIRAAMRAFAQHGYDGSTLSDIPAEAGVSQPRISQIFGSTEYAFREALRVSSKVLLDALEVAAAGSGRSDFLGAFNRLCAREPEALTLVFQGFTTTTVPRVCEECRRILSRLLDVVVTRAGCSYDDALLLLGLGLRDPPPAGGRPAGPERGVVALRGHAGRPGPELGGGPLPPVRGPRSGRRTGVILRVLRLF